MKALFIPATIIFLYGCSSASKEKCENFPINDGKFSYFYKESRLLEKTEIHNCQREGISISYDADGSVARDINLKIAQIVAN